MSIDLARYPSLEQRVVLIWITPEVEADIQARQCLKVRLLAEHMAPTVLFLAADDSAQLTGQQFPVDGGWA